MKSRQQTSRLSNQSSLPTSHLHVCGAEAVPRAGTLQHPRVQTELQAIVASLEISRIPCTADLLKHVSRHRCCRRALLGIAVLKRPATTNTHHGTPKAEAYSQQHVLTGVGEFAEDRGYDQCV